MNFIIISVQIWFSLVLQFYLYSMFYLFICYVNICYSIIEDISKRVFVTSCDLFKFLALARIGLSSTSTLVSSHQHSCYVPWNIW